MAAVVVGDENAADWVNGDGWLSDDSSYYGDDERVMKRGKNLPLKTLSDIYKQIHDKLPYRIAHVNRPKVLQDQTPAAFNVQPMADFSRDEGGPVPTSVERAVLSKYDKGKRKASAEEEAEADRVMRNSDLEVHAHEPLMDWQMEPSLSSPHTIKPKKARISAPSEALEDSSERHPDESVSAFLSRIPPSKSHILVHGPWLWIHNTSMQCTSPYNFDKEALMSRGEALLEGYRTLESRTRTSMPGKTPSAIGRKLTPKRKELELDIRKLAKETGCLSGKWMLFPLVEDVDRVWSIVCHALDAGKLGPTAKVATNGEARNPREENCRLICVYTKDFTDEKDVRRVLNALVESELVKLPEDDMGNGVYYKCDAYTYLNIMSGNEYKLKASIYGSKEVLKGVKWGDR